MITRFSIRIPALIGLALAAAGLGGCGATDRLATIGQPPVLSAIEDPTAQPGYKPVRMPMPDPAPVAYSGASSLWRTGSRAFFKDQRAAQVGDIMTVRVRVTDRAQLDNSTKRSRSNGEDLGAANMFGLETKLGEVIPGAKADALLKLESDAKSEGAGSVRRSEQLVTDVAAVVTQVLPNGNLVIEGKQEIRVNFEVREMIVAGVVRPEDIEAGNTIESTKIAQARIAYGGRGQITDVQQPRYGQQVMDVLLPF